MQNSPKFIGICGISGSGKSFLIDKLVNAFPEELSVLSTDNYYLPLHMQIKDANGIENFDVPSSINAQKLVEDLKSLSDGKSILVEKYAFNVASAKPEFLTIQPRKLVLVEGIFVLAIPELRNIFDQTIMVKSDLDKILEKRIARDVAERGMEEALVRYQWFNHVLPGYEKFVLPFANGVEKVVHNDHNSLGFYEEVKREIMAYL